MNVDNDQEAANGNAAALVAGILKSYGWDADRIKKHKDWTGKNCPSQLLSASKWNSFKKLVEGAMKQAEPLVPLAHEEAVSAQNVTALPADIPDFEIDHRAIEDMINVTTRQMVADTQTVSSTPEESLAKIIETLTAGGQTSWPKFFPGGINHVELKIDSSGFHAIVKGPGSENTVGAHEVYAEADDTVPSDGFEIQMLLAPPKVTSYLSDNQYVYGTRTPSRRFGVAKTIQAINKVGQEFFGEFGVRVGIGDISKEGGGPIGGHASHQKGVDVDVRLPRTDGREADTNYKATTYSRERTQALVNLFRHNGVFSVTHIFFNDPNVSGVSKWPNHDDHLHVRFNITEA